MNEESTDLGDIVRKGIEELTDIRVTIQRQESEERELIAETFALLGQHFQAIGVAASDELASEIYWSNEHLAHQIRKTFKTYLDTYPKIKKSEWSIPCPSCQKAFPHFAKSWAELHKLEASLKKKPLPHDFPICAACARQKEIDEKKAKREWLKSEDSKQEQINHLRSLPYSDYLQTDHWKHVRLEALRRASFRCQLCNASESLDVHHRTYENLGSERFNDVIALCRPCHEKHHDIASGKGGES